MASAETTDVHGDTRHLYLLGHHISHSLSPRFHNTIYTSLNLPWKFHLLDTPNPRDLLPRMHDPSFAGASITMPHKVTFIDHVDELTDAGKTIRAINTVFIRDDPTTGKRTYVGTNTDCIGVRDAILNNYPDTVRGKPAVVLGGGGACRAAVYAMLSLMGASEVYLVNRDAGEVEDVIGDFRLAGLADRCVHVRTVEQAQGLPPATVIVGTVPDVAPLSEDEIRARDIVACFLRRSTTKGVLLDMCYHPRLETALIVSARKEGWGVVYGNEAFFYQALAQVVLLTGRTLDELPIETVRELICPNTRETGAR
ncbi:NAD(P)-binding protein [Phialemonium atrogriseum]|uniref:NAD(P)-binding protein n=1 Tax=Phialemonium atrogriseum TaxID=1093897 RepID=A0AAJ0FBG1_9PEZI|nr:NAD(P)-binding protein [Phialemonium atrogriseum]KAK1762431.1 NAD(P)-binding protein [Phialemonium atrogriseum]